MIKHLKRRKRIISTENKQVVARAERVGMDKMGEGEWGGTGFQLWNELVMKIKGTAKGI